MKDDDNTEIELDLETNLKKKKPKKTKGKKDKGESSQKELPKKLFILPLTRRPFFPGMAAPLVIEPGIYYEVLKDIARSEDKVLGLFLTKEEDVNIYKMGFDELNTVGVVARVLRIIPLEQGGGAQVVLSMERRVKIDKPVKNSKYLQAHVSYHEDKVSDQESKAIKAYSISIISTIKELLKLNPLFKEELQIFLGHSDFTEPGRLADFAVALTTATREELQDVVETFNVENRIDKALLLLKK
ncbi:LON peptidase substrate-binding domain-containing protein, partial [bacterium]|nr:LON peptidase substrate-binding domain-containing protein [bacterium]